MDLLHLVDRLEELIAEAQKMPIGNRVIIDRRRLLDLIDQMRTSIPQEVREARELVSDRDLILRDAKEESSIIAAHAEEAASSLVEDHAITESARERAQEIADEAERRLTQRVEQANEDIQIRIDESSDLARQQMQAADDYALELLRRLDRQLQAFVGSVQSGIQQVEPERELPAIPYPGEFDPGPPAPGNFHSDEALGSLPEDEHHTEDLTLTRHELPDTSVPTVSQPEPVVMTEDEPEAVSFAAEAPPVTEKNSPRSSRFGDFGWGSSAASEPLDEIEDTEDIADSITSPDADQRDTSSQKPTSPEIESVPESATGGGLFSSLFNRLASETSPPPARADATPERDPVPVSLVTNLPEHVGRLPGVGSDSQPAASVDAGIESTAKPSEANGDNVDERPAIDEPDRSSLLGVPSASPDSAASGGEFEDLLARARDNTEPPTAQLPADQVQDLDSTDEPAAVIDDFDNPPLDDDPIHGSEPSADDRQPSNGAS